MLNNIIKIFRGYLDATVLSKEDLFFINEHQFKAQKDVDNVIVPDVTVELDYVYQAIKATKELLNDDIPLIGFAGSPWTILCYCVQGQ